VRILEVTDCYPPPFAGGREITVRLLCQELARRGHDVAVATMAGPDGPRIEDDGPVAVHRLAGWSRLVASLYADPNRPFHPTLPDPGLVRALSKLLKTLRPQVVHAHSWLLYSLLPLLPSPETALVVWVHGQGFVCPKTTYWYRGGVCSGPRFAKCIPCAASQYGAARAVALTTGLTVMTPFRGRVDRYVANSRFTAESSARLLGGSARTMDVIPPLVPDEAFRAPQGERPSFVPREGDYLMFAGALGPHKGLDVLLEAWQRLDHRPPLVVAGIRRVDSPSVFPDAVTVAENVLHEDVLRGLGHALAAVVPSVWPEPFGTVALEAMAAARPVVASAVGGLAELVVDDVTGIHVPPGDVPALAAALERIVGDEPLRARLGAAGLERAGAYSAGAVAAAWERVFDDAVRHRRGPGSVP